MNLKIICSITLLFRLLFYLNTKWTKIALQAKVPSSVKNTTRYIPQAPDRILDAPDIVDDYCKYIYYCTLLKEII